jgi:hypothetical protein
MLKPLIQKTRAAILARENRARLKSTVDDLDSGLIPIFFIFTPDIAHLAPYCILNVKPPFKPILVMNAVPKEDIAWINSLHPDLPLVELKHSLRQNSASLLPHSDVLNDLFAVVPGNFCIQDPDCFVVDQNFYTHVSLSKSEFAAGPFWEQNSTHGHIFPYTYFVIFNTTAFRVNSSKFGTNADVIRKMPRRAAREIASMGYQPGEFPEPTKNYFDTLQAHWLLSLSAGLTFRQLPGIRESVFHVGGTSYVTSNTADVSASEYWPLAVQYFNLRLLELRHGERFRNRFHDLIERYGSSDDLLSRHPEFRDCWRFADISRILEFITAAEKDSANE